MAVHDYVIDNSTGANVRADINNALLAIVSNNSSSSEPSTTKYAYMWWADTTNGILKIRNSANDGWVELLQLDGTLTMEDGSASTPGLAFRDDLNTGIFSSAADNLDIATGGSVRVNVSSSGLTVSNDLIITDKIVHSGDTNTAIRFPANDEISVEAGGVERLRINSTGDKVIAKDTTAAVLRIENSTAAASQTATLDMAPANSLSGVQMVCTSDEDFSTGANRTASFKIKVRKDGGFNDTLAIDSSGNVMLGLTSTSNKFHVEGTTTGSRFGVDVSSSGIPAIAVTNESNADVEFVIFDGRSSIGSSVNIPLAFHTNGKTNETMRITTDGRLLVGHSNNQGVAGGSSKIQVQSNDSSGRISIVQHRNEASGAPFLSLGKTRATSVNNSTLVQSGDTLGTIAFAGGDGTDIHSVAAQIVCQVDDTAAANDMPGRLVFFTTPDGSDTPAEVMRMIHAGHICGHGMTGLTANTNVSGFAFSYQSDHGRLNMHAKGSAATPTLLVAFYHSANHVGGIRVTSSSTAYGTTSDYRLKENAVAISDGITRLKTLKPYKFNFKSDASTTVDGFFAHEVTAVPEAVIGTKDETFTEDDETRGAKAGDPKYQEIDQSKLVPLLVAAVQELITKVETLEAA